MGGGQSTEHPRVCGENSRNPPPPLPMRGTSPRMRGKPFEPKAAHSTSRNIPAYAGKPVAPRGQAHRRRNIPAYAGKTRTNPTVRQNSLEHPRVCGENRGALSFGVGQVGTSPRMRGKRRFGGYQHQTVRNIPAYAGKTEADRLANNDSAEHPRVCGENNLT